MINRTYEDDSPLHELFETKKKNATFFTLMDLGDKSYDITYKFGDNLNGNY